MRSLIVLCAIVLCVLALCADIATAGPILDRIRENRAERKAQRCQPAPIPPANVPQYGCPGGVCPVPARVPAYLPPAASAPKVVRWEYRCVGGRCQLVQVVE